MFRTCFLAPTKPVWRHTLPQFESASVNLSVRGTIVFSPSSVLWGNGERALLLTENTVHSGEGRLSKNKALLVYVSLVLEALLNQLAGKISHKELTENMSADPLINFVAGG